MTVPRTGRETTTIRITGKAENTPVPVKRLSTERGDYLTWTPDGSAVTWALGSRFHRQALVDAEPTTTDVRVEVQRRRPSGSILLTGARIVTMGDDEVIANGDVLVTDNRIAAVGRRGSLTIPAGARRVSVAGRTIMPDLVDAHAHIR